MDATFDAARTLETVRRLQQQLNALQQTRRGPIAVRGVALRLPGGVCCTESLWRLLSGVEDAFGPTPNTRWEASDFPNIPNIGAFLSDAQLGFDRTFWNLSPAETQAMDPQQRLALTLAWEALQDAGVAPHTLAGEPVGVYFGCTGSDFATRKRNGQTALGPYSGTGLAGSMLANRVSHRLDLRGPSLTLDAACASSLLALQIAVEHLRNKTCSWAIVGGTALMLDPGPSQIFAESGVLSSSGACRPFDEAADGFLRGEGAVVLVLQRLDDAKADRASIRGIIEGVASTQDGRTTSLTLPSTHAHEQAARDALQDAGREAHEIGLIEVHAAGTPVADPIEAHAIGNVYGRDDQPAYIGSVKGHVGHTEGVCGLVSLVKVLAALEHQQIPPQANLDTPSAHLGLTEAGLAVPTTSQPWPKTAALAAVHSYGYGGTNVHAILRPSERHPPATPPDTPLCLDLSGADPAAVVNTANALHEHLAKTDDVRIVCWAWNVRQSPLRYRCVVFGEDNEALLAGLRSVTLDDAYRIRPAEQRDVLTSLHDLRARHTEGHEVDWLTLYPGRLQHPLGLPRYAWQHSTEFTAAPTRRPTESPEALPRYTQGQDLRVWLSELCGALLGFQHPLERDTPLAEQGFDSIIAVRLVRALADNGFDLPLHLLTDGPSPNTIAELLTSTAMPATQEAPLGGTLWSHVAALCLGACIMWGISYLAGQMLPEDGAWIRTPDVTANGNAVEADR